jgi:hypothetical protein
MDRARSPPRSAAAHGLTTVGRRPLVDDELALFDRDHRECVDVDGEQIPVVRRLDAAR